MSTVAAPPRPRRWALAWPLMAELVLGYGVIYSWPVIIVGAVFLLLGLFGWVLEPAEVDH